MKPIARMSRLDGEPRLQDRNAPGILAALKVEPGQQGRPAVETGSSMIRPRERSAVIAAWALSLLINVLCAIVFMIAFHREDVPRAQTPAPELPAGPVPQVVSSMANPLAPQPAAEQVSQRPDAGQKAAPEARLPTPVSKKKQREYKLRKELHRLQQDFLQDAPK
jgi:hypothetical protein